MVIENIPRNLYGDHLSVIIIVYARNGYEIFLALPAGKVVMDFPHNFKGFIA